MNKKFSSKFAAIIITLLACSSLTVIAAQSEPQVADPLDNIRHLQRSAEFIRRCFRAGAAANYVEPVEDKKLIEYALNGMLSPASTSLRLHE